MDIVDIILEKDSPTMESNLDAKFMRECAMIYSDQDDPTRSCRSRIFVMSTGGSRGASPSSILSSVSCNVCGYAAVTVSVFYHAVQSAS